MTRAGLLTGLGAAALYGSTFPVIKHVLNGGVDPLVLFGLIGAFQGVFFGSSQLLFPPSRERRLRRGDACWMLLAVATGAVVAPTLYGFGQEMVPAYAAALLAPTEIFFAALVAVGFFGERISAREATGMGLVVLGAAGVGIRIEQIGNTEVTLWGALLVMGGFMMWGIGDNAVTKIAERDPFQIMLFKSTVTGGSFLAVATVLGREIPTEPILLVEIAVLAIAQHGMALVLFILAMRRLGAARATALFGTNPAFGVLGAWLGLREQPGWLSVAAGALILAGIFFLAPRTKPARPGSP